MKRRTLIIALFLLAVAGLMLHYRIHPFMVPDKLNPGHTVFNPTKFVGASLNIIDVFFVTLLFMSRRTAAYGFLLNGLIVIYGTILMSHYGIAEMIAKSLPVSNLIFKSTLPDIAIAWGDFMIGKALYDYYMTLQGSESLSSASQGQQCCVQKDLPESRDRGL